MRLNIFSLIAAGMFPFLGIPCVAEPPAPAGEVRKAAELEFPANTVLEIRVGRSPGGDAMRTAELPAAALAPEPKLLPVQAFRRR